MIKMYNAEVLGKFPVVQHFPFGFLFSWDRDPNAVPPPTSVHTASGPQSRSNETAPSATMPAPGGGTKAPWATASKPSPPMGPTVAPWAASGTPVARGPPVLPDTSRMPPGPMAPTRARAEPSGGPASGDLKDIHTKAPWAK